MRKLCLLDERGSELSSGCRKCSKTSIAGQRREMERLLVPKSAGLPRLGTGVLIVFPNGGNIVVVD